MTNYLQYGKVGPEGGAFYLLNPSDDAEIITDFFDPDKNPVTFGMIRYNERIRRTGCDNCL